MLNERVEQTQRHYTNKTFQICEKSYLYHHMGHDVPKFENVWHKNRKIRKIAIFFTVFVKTTQLYLWLEND